MSDECPICMEIIKEQNRSITSCNHTFHTNCLCTAVLRKGVCPICRNSLIIGGAEPSTTIRVIDLADAFQSLRRNDEISHLDPETRETRLFINPRRFQFSMERETNNNHSN